MTTPRVLKPGDVPLLAVDADEVRDLLRARGPALGPVEPADDVGRAIAVHLPEFEQWLHPRLESYWMAQKLVQKLPQHAVQLRWLQDALDDLHQRGDTNRLLSTFGQYMPGHTEVFCHDGARILLGRDWPAVVRSGDVSDIRLVLRYAIASLRQMSERNPKRRPPSGARDALFLAITEKLLSYRFNARRWVESAGVYREQQSLTQAEAALRADHVLIAYGIPWVSVGSSESANGARKRVLRNARSRRMRAAG